VGPCARRLCGLHGRSSGPLICGECERKREQEAAAVQADARKAEERAKNSLDARMSSVTSASELLKIIRETDIGAEIGAYRRAWLQLVSLGSVSASHNVVETHGREFAHGLIPTFGRAAKRGTWSPPTPIIEIWPSFDDEVWLDANGIAYKSEGSVRLMILDDSPKAERFVLPKGETAIFRRNKRDPDPYLRARWFEVSNGFAITQDEDRYALTLELVLDNVCTT
jgi:hypothetical protein